MTPIVLHDLDGLRCRLAPHLGRTRTAIVFGSVARGDADEWSDLDLVIVTETSRPFLERYRDFEGLYDVWPLLDLLGPLAQAHPTLGSLRGAAARLDQLYIPTRYPNGLPGGVPAEVFSKEQAGEAIAQAAEFIEQATALLR